LWIGALGAVAACLTGWSYAVYEGYGKNIGFDLAASALDRHRWAGVFVALFSLLTLPLAVSVRRNGSIGKRMLWLMASCIAAGAVSVAGYQGGELTYGEDHYMRYFEQLFPPADAQTPDQQAGEEQNSQQSETQSPDEKTTEPSTAETKTPSPETADSSSTPDSPQAEVTTPEPTEPASRESSSAESTSSEPSVAEPSATEAPAPDATEPQTPTPESASPNAPSQPEAK
jgi:hypothetical protein